MTQRWYLTFHGGDDDADWNNIHAYDLDGEPLGKALDTHTLPDGLALRELRGFSFGPDGDLFVANAYKNASQVLRFAGRPGPNGDVMFRQLRSPREAELEKRLKDLEKRLAELEKQLEKR